MAGAVAVVTAMATGTWEATRAKVVEIFRRGGRAQQEAIETQLDGDTALVAQRVDREGARLAVVGSWGLRLDTLLREHPDAATELQALINDRTASLSPGLNVWVQQGTVDGGSFGIFQGDGGNVHLHDTSVTHRPPGTAATDGHIGDSR